MPDIVASTQQIIVTPGTQKVQVIQGISRGAVEEAPANGNSYARKDGAWVQVSAELAGLRCRS